MSAARCSFCGNSDGCFVAGPVPIWICHRCVAKCNAFLAKHREATNCEKCATGDGPQPLTKRQAQMYAYLGTFIASHGYAPSFTEIADQFGYTSLATVAEHLGNIERKGWIRRRYNESRSIELVAATPLTPH